ncbi:MAG TPA: hypothetical protein VFQ45_13225 [Longimicrobium sp.]|nr:hypothetical protein [Longimicrobium sp.]
MRLLRTAATAVFAFALAGCPAPATQPPATTPGQPAPDPAAAAALADEVQRATVPAGPRQVAFAWELDEAGARFRGRGVGRYVAPERFRLDLFGPRGETYLSAALVDGTVRAPAILLERFKLPSPALLWGAIGVVRPPADARLVDATRAGDEATLRYAAGGDAFEYRLEGGRLRTLRRRAGGGVAESIDLTYDVRGVLQRAGYRDWAAYRSLNLTLESSQDVAPFPESIWTPPGT